MKQHSVCTPAFALWIAGIALPAVAGATQITEDDPFAIHTQPFMGLVRTLHQGEVLRGDLVVENLFIPPDVTAFVAEDVHITAGRTIRIDGHLECLSVDSVQRSNGTWDLEALSTDAPKLGLAAAEWIDIRGQVIGGQGADLAGLDDVALVGQRGGSGSTLFLEAPLIWIDGQVRGGRGGSAAAGGEGGAGGSVIAHGRVLTYNTDPYFPEMLGGDAGVGGRGLAPTRVDGRLVGGAQAGRGGSGGDAIAMESGQVSIWEFLSGSASASATASQDSWSFGALSGDDNLCGVGDRGANGGDAEGGQGATGGPGAHGTVDSPQGATGGTGGKGGEGNASANRGSNGKVGGECCHGVGGKGGPGGDGGKGSGGQGGTGGPGGNGLWETNEQFPTGHWAGPAGMGGTGGPGGDGKSGNGGDGGPGGKGKTGGEGGDKGHGVAGVKGPAGVGGPPGSGSQVNFPGGPGGLGGSANGTNGGGGDPGGVCPVDVPNE